MQSFENFLTDLGPKPSPKHSLDRINPAGNYEPENCRWITIKEQQNNKNNNQHINVDGNNLTIAEVALLIGVPYRTLANRFHKYQDGLITYEQLLLKGNQRCVYLPTGESLTQAAKRIGITITAVKYRMHRYAIGKMSINEALGIRS
jgi:hypothetical protein